MSLLSATLRADLNSAIFEKYVIKHTIFFVWSELDCSILAELCFAAIEIEAFAIDDYVFVPVEPAQKTYLLTEGSLRYERRLHVSEASPADELRTRRCSPIDRFHSDGRDDKKQNSDEGSQM